MPGHQNETKASIAVLISGIMQERGWSAARLAREAGVSPSTITRALDPASPFTPSATTVAKIAQSGGMSSQAVRRLISQNNETLEAFDAAQVRQTSGAAPIVGTIAAGVWRDQSFKERSWVGSTPIWDSSWSDDTLLYKMGASDHPAFPLNSVVAVCRKPQQIFREDTYLLRRRAEFEIGTMTELALWRLDFAGGQFVMLRDAAGPNVPAQRLIGMDADVVGIVVGTYAPRLAGIDQPTAVTTSAVVEILEANKKG